ncbi:MAG: 1,4-dihydroxy-2-naphthoate octaprenyltransferase [Flavobacteriales bacterium]|nr:1,4-dihydroxy-2-naphthoate octaprenyltransferase [Flavobacteriales bacterium]
MKLKAWISAFRLRTLPLALSCVIAGSGIAWSNSSFNWLICVLTVITTILLQVLSNLANDYGDAKKGTDNDARLGPERAVQSGIISSKQMMIGIIVCGILALGSGVTLLLISLQPDWKFLCMLGLGLLGIMAAIKYTMGKSAYGYKGLGDLFVFLFFGLIGVLGTVYLQTQTIELLDLIPATCIGLLSAGVLNLNNMRDHKNDANHQKRTLVVSIGFKMAKFYHLLITIPPILMLGFYIWISSPGYSLLFLILPLTILLFAIVRVIKTTDERLLDPELKKLALTTFLSSVLFSLSLCTSF